MTKAEFEKEVAKQMALLGISRADAEDLVRFDNDEIENEVVEDLSTKAKQNRTYVSSGTRKTPQREYKCDEDKVHLLDKLMGGLKGITAIDSVTNDASFNFSFNGVEYTVKLIKHRPHKS